MIVNITTTQNNYFDRTETLVRYYEDIRKYLPLDIQREHELIDIYQNSRDANEKEKIQIGTSGFTEDSFSPFQLIHQFLQQKNQRIFVKTYPALVMP